MAKVIWWHFCEHHTTDASGKSSYISVFDNTTIHIRSSDPTGKLTFPLPFKVTTCPFVFSVGLRTEPDVQSPCEVQLIDSDGESVLPPLTGTLGPNPQGNNNLHMNFRQGIPVVRPGIYTFVISVAGQEVGRADLPVDVQIHEEEGQ